MSVYYINGTSTSGSTFGTNGFFYPLYLTASEANSASANTLGTSHPHTFEEAPNITFYMPTTGVTPIGHALTTPPTGNYSSEVYVSYTSPIAEVDVEEIGFGVLAGDTFNSWRKKTNDVARETITNTATIGSVDTRLTRLLSVTGGENNIMTLTSSDNITGEKEFEGLVKFTSADDSANAIQVGANGKIYVESSEFKFTKSIDLHTAGGTLKASELDVPTGRTKYANTTYTWPSAAPIPGQILKAGTGNSLSWATENAAEANVEAFLIEDPNPIGSVMLWTEASAPSKWLLCKGQSLNTFTYKALHAVLNNTYGGTAFAAGTTDQSGAATTFNLPDLRGRVPVGLGESSDVNGLLAKFNTLGGKKYTSNSAEIGGEFQHTINHTITNNEMPPHKHYMPLGGAGGSAGDYGLTYGERSTNAVANQTNHQRATYYAGGTSNDDGSAGASGTQSTTQGTNDPISITTQNVQPFITLNYIIKYEGSTIVTQNVTPSNGILINDAAAQTNLLAANSVNTIKMDVDSSDFKFNGNQLQLADDIGTHIVQAVNLAATRSATAPVIGQFVDYPSLEVTITPRATGSKFLISGDAHVGAYTTGHDYVSKYVYKKNSGSYVSFLLPTSSGSRVAGHGVHYAYADRHDDIGNVKPATLLMTPASYVLGDTLTFKIQVASTYTHSTARHYFNNSEGTTDTSGYARTISQITVQEIAG